MPVSSSGLGSSPGSGANLSPGSLNCRAPGDAESITGGGGSQPPLGASQRRNSSVPQGYGGGNPVEAEQLVLNQGVTRSNRVSGSTEEEFEIDRTTIIVMGARNEAKLLKFEKKLQALGIPYVADREPDAPYFGQLMSIGLWPGLHGDLTEVVNDFQRFKFNFGSANESA